jgi:signal transduction histidine kinase
MAAAMCGRAAGSLVGPAGRASAIQGECCLNVATGQPMVERPLRALIVEDNELDARLLIRELRRGYVVTFMRVETAAAMRDALETQAWDVILADYAMPAFSAPAALKLLKEVEVDVPFIIISGTIGEETAIDCMRAGAQDFIVKGKLGRLLPAIEREITDAQARRERIAERMRTEVERERLLNELREAVKARDILLAMVSHELRTPLTSLQLQIQLFQRTSRREPPERMSVEALESTVGVIARQVGRLRTLIDGLLDATRITSGRLILGRETVDLSDLVTEIVAHSRSLMPHVASEVTIESEPVVGHWDRLRIESVVANLMSNALKFGEGKPIHVSVSRNGSSARLAVSDQGIGLTAEQQTRIFDKFERAVSELHYGGVGLGLWIVRQIVEAHGGTTTVVSEPGHGSLFVVDLPLGEGE